MDPHRVNNLISYLEKVQERGLATKDHKTLLLSCYTKIKDDEKIKLFLQNHIVALTGPTTATVLSSGLSSKGTVNTSATIIATATPSADMNVTSSSTLNFDSLACVDVLVDAGYIGMHSLISLLPVLMENQTTLFCWRQSTSITTRTCPFN